MLTTKTQRAQSRDNGAACRMHRGHGSWRETMLRLSFGSVLSVSSCVHPSLAAEPDGRPTAATPQRTGNTDGKAGPASAARSSGPCKAKDHFIAAPVAARRPPLRLRPRRLQRLDVLRPRRRPQGQAARRLDEDDAAPRSCPRVSSPAVVGGKLIFGDGMHQTDGAVAATASTSTTGPPLLAAARSRATSSTWKARRRSRTARSTSAAARPASSAWT